MHPTQPYSAFTFGSASELLLQHGIIGPRRTLDLLHIILTPHRLTDANTSNSFLPFTSSDPNWSTNVWSTDPTSPLSNTLPKTFCKVFQQTTDRMRLWGFVGHLTGFCHAVKLLCQHCIQIRVRVVGKESTVHGQS